MRPSTDQYFLSMLAPVASRSTCGRRAVGAILVDHRHRIVGVGHNGVPAGFPHCTEVGCPGRFDPSGDTRRCLSIHAEINCLLNATRLDLAHALYVSCSPCFNCSKVIANTSIRRVVCLEPYAEQNDVLATAGIEVVYKPISSSV